MKQGIFWPGWFILFAYTLAGVPIVSPDVNYCPGGRPATMAMDLWQIIDSIPAFVWCASPDGSIEFLNQRGLAYTGFSLEQIRGWSWRDTNILHPDDMQGLFQTWSAIVASGQEGEIQARMRRYDGEYRWFLFRVAPFYDSSGRLVAWIGIDIEIDERRRVESLLAAEKRTLEMIAGGASLPDILKDLCRTIDSQGSPHNNVYFMIPIV